MISDLIIYDEFKDVYFLSIDGRERMENIKYVEHIQYELNNNNTINYEFVFNDDWNSSSFMVENSRHYPLVEWYGWEFINKPNYYTI